MDNTYFEAHSPCGQFHKCNNGAGCDNCEFQGEE